tara:strand:+ start:801 stop:998 length:198 start_codon:yes stop_codon:yes gene_type:complete
VQNSRIAVENKKTLLLFQGLGKKGQDAGKINRRKKRLVCCSGNFDKRGLGIQTTIEAKMQNSQRG